MNSSGIVVIRKEKGFTSHDVVAVVKRTLRIKAGHTGTLDPQAEGVLPVCVGKATRLAGYLAADDKTYVAEVHLGITTDTGDTSGTILETRQVDFNEEKIRAAVSSFQGEQLQTPPMYSAIKVNGKKLYELARKGETVEREPRRIFIRRIEILRFDSEKSMFTVEAECSKGTYIRSLCEDIGKALGCGACMGDLLRTRSGIFTLDMAVKLGDLSEADVLPPQNVLPYCRADVSPEAAKLAVNGNPIPVSKVSFEAENTASLEKFLPSDVHRDEIHFHWLYLEENLIGLYKNNGGFLTPEVMLI